MVCTLPPGSLIGPMLWLNAHSCISWVSRDSIATCVLCRWRVGCSKLDAQAPQLPVQRPECQLQLRIQQVPCKRLLLLPSEKPQEPVRGFCGANFCIHLECRALVLLRQKHCFDNILLRGTPLVVTWILKVVCHACRAAPPVFGFRFPKRSRRGAAWARHLLCPRAGHEPPRCGSSLPQSCIGSPGCSSAVSELPDLGAASC